MLKLARWSTTHKVYVIAGWIVLIVAINALAQAAGTKYSNNFTLPNSDAQRASDLLERSFPAQAGDRDQIVFKVSHGTVRSPAVKARVSAMLGRVARLPHVTTVVSPYGAAAGDAISKSGRIAFATVLFDQKASTLPKSAAKRVIRVAKDAARPGLQVDLGGQAVAATEAQGFGLSTAIGLVAAVVVLLVTFGSMIAMGLPIVTALFGLGAGLGLIALFTHVVDTPDFSSELAAMIGLGVGIDYALFIVTRFREAYWSPGSSFGKVRESVVEAMDTAGRAVLFAGCTVVVALLGMMLLGVTFLYGVALSAAIGVLLVMLGSLTLLPALLTLAGGRLVRLSRRARRAGRDAEGAAPANGNGHGASPAKGGGHGSPTAEGNGHGASPAKGGGRGSPTAEGNGHGASPAKGGGHRGRSAGGGPADATAVPIPAGAGMWLRWSAFVQRRPRTIALVSALAMLLIAAPAASLRLGSSDAANEPASYTTHQAYMLLAEGFGPGFNGPLDIAVQLPRRAVGAGASTDAAALRRLSRAISATPGVASVTPPRIGPTGDVATVTAYPTSSPQAAATTDLVSHLREDVIPPVASATGMRVYVGGVTAGAVDFANTLSEKLPLFIGVVVLVSALLLMIVFRSLIVPLQAAVMNLLSIGASLGVIVAIFQWGWLPGLFGVSPGPIESFIPVMLFAIVFGLSMDYEVFLISRMHERWVRTGDPSRAVGEGLALTGRVITAAAAIMVVVFLSFMVGNDRVIQEFGLSLASAVLLDALVVRSMLLPAVLDIVGGRSWWLPRWLDRRLPRLNVEGSPHHIIAFDRASVPTPPPASAGGREAGRSSTGVGADRERD